jgi:hypothetical protein
MLRNPSAAVGRRQKNNAFRYLYGVLISPGLKNEGIELRQVQQAGKYMIGPFLVSRRNLCVKLLYLS